MRDSIYLNLKFRNDVFLKKSALGKPVMELKPSDIKKSFKKLWWEKSSEMHVELHGEMLNEKEMQHLWHCLYN